MSNYLAIATATAVFGQKIYQAMSAVEQLSAAPMLYIRRPEKNQQQIVGAYLYLYKVEHNNSLRNNELATRGPDGALVRQPQLALNLNYHLSFYGQDNSLEPQRLMGAAAMALHAEPFITPQEIKAYLEMLGPQSYLAGSDLYRQPGRLKIEPTDLSLEDVSKMWSMFFQVPHEVYLNYQLSVILMESQLPLQKPLPVSTVAIAPLPSPPPRLLSVEPACFEYPGPGRQRMLSLQGEDLSPELEVEFNGAAPALRPSAGDKTSLKVLAPDSLWAGLNSLCLLKLVSDGEQILSLRSEPVSIIVQPLIDRLHVQTVLLPQTGEPAAVLTLRMRPEPLAHQRLTLWLNSKIPAGPNFDSSQLLSFSLAADAAAIEAGHVGEDLRAGFAQAGIQLSRRPRLSRDGKNRHWLLEDGHHFYSLRLVQGSLLCYYGFSAADQSDCLSFRLPAEARGSFLVRVQVDGLQFAESVLIPAAPVPGSGPPAYAGPKVTIP